MTDLVDTAEPVVARPASAPSVSCSASAPMAWPSPDVSSAVPFAAPEATTPVPPRPAAPVVATDAEPESPAIVTGPAAVLAPDTAIAPVDAAAISLPQTAAVASARPPATETVNPFLLGADIDPARRPTRTKKKRWPGVVLTALLLGGVGYAGVTYGPEAYEEYFGEETVDEPAAPLAFPRARASAPEVRTATLVLAGLTAESEAVYTVTVDFETGVSRVVIDRQDSPDLEVLTFSDDALVRRLDSDEWFQIERGSFPLDDQLRRADWIRMIDDLVPPAVRSDVVIEASTASTVAGVDTRHLVLTLDPAILSVDQGVAPLDPMGDLALAATDAPDVATSEITPTGEALPTTAVPQPVTLDGEASAAAGAAAPNPNAIEIELWIDGQGVVRRAEGADVLGARSIAISETSTEAWVPDYPAEANVAPMTAAALIELGL